MILTRMGVGCGTLPGVPTKWLTFSAWRTSPEPGRLHLPGLGEHAARSVETHVVDTVAFDTVDQVGARWVGIHVDDRLVHLGDLRRDVA